MAACHKVVEPSYNNGKSNSLKHMLQFMVLSVLALAFTHPAFAEPNAVAPRNRTEAIAIIEGLRRVVTPNGIERLETVRINGVDQWVSIRSRDRSNPVLLVVHGGPGWMAMPTSWYFAQGWEEYFTVIQWDQRGAGKTYGASDPETIAATLTVEQMQRDLEAVVRWARADLGQDRIFLLGHSWGSVLGLDLAHRHPEWLHAYIGVGQAVDMRESERRGWAWAMARAQDAANETALAELQSIAPYAEGSAPIPLQAVMLQRKWVNAYGGASYNRPDSSFEGAAIALAPEYNDDDVRRVWETQALSVERLFPSVLETDLSSLTDLKGPIILLLGRHDVNVSAEVAADWFARIEASMKRLIWFEHSADELMVEEPGKTLLTLVQEVRPLAKGP